LNYAELTPAVLNSLVVCLASIVLAVPVGTALAILLIRTDIVGKGWLWLAIGSQITTPLYVVAGSWNAGFGSQGWWPFSHVLTARGEYSPLIAVSFIHAVAAIPWVCAIISLGLMWTNRSLEESALVESGNTSVLWRVLLPGLRPWLALSCMWCCIPVLTEMVISNLYQVPTVAEQVYLDASRGTVTPLTYPIAVAFCMLPILTVTMLISRRLPPWSEMVARASQHAPQTLLWRKRRLSVSLAAWCVVLGLVFLPIVNLKIKAGWQPYTDAENRTQYTWSLSRYFTTLTESLTLFTREFYWSTVLAIGSATTALLLAFTLQLCMRGRWQRSAVALAMLALIGTPGALVGTLMIFLLNRSQPALLGELFDRTLLAPILAQQFRLLPLAMLIVLGLSATIDRRSWELAEQEGLSIWQRFRTIVWPQTGSRWILAWLILAVLSVGELSSTILVLPPGVTTLSMRLFEMLHFGMRHQDSGLCLLLLAIGWGVSAIVLKTLTDRNRPLS
jgi:iron(III) transport system permease protein